ncbi:MULTISPECIES: alpha/beta fold hydrolase [unclassified Burkholderia]|uniref:alpha/beta hydrolase family protein n=1 Tax=unclassified Burkholderia TaxID=2613784 RepID=UPI001FC85880|nr:MULTISPECIES: alpha/beta fold hydrolase [unclassified Burkholderia]
MLICPATGLRQSFYFAFAAWLRCDGHPTFVFDYRGIGASRDEGHVRRSVVRKQDWEQLDMPAALDWLLGETGASDAHLIGHSAGAQLVGLMPNHASVRSLCAISASSGYVGNVRWPMRVAALLLANLYVPVSARLFGYVPARVLGWGDDLPARVGLQWARWCRRPGYMANEFGIGVTRHYYDEFVAPVTVVAATDDPLATPANIEDWLRWLPNASRDVHFIAPKNCDGRESARRHVPPREFVVVAGTHQGNAGVNTLAYPRPCIRRLERPASAQTAVSRWVTIDSFPLGNKSSTTGIFVTETVSLILRAHHPSRVRPCRSVICFLPHSRRLHYSAPHPRASPAR